MNGVSNHSQARQGSTGLKSPSTQSLKNILKRCNLVNFLSSPSVFSGVRIDVWLKARTHRGETIKQ
ncbi:hypothetical protein F7725_002581, partial [Dissostichus mawsoni]